MAKERIGSRKVVCNVWSDEARRAALEARRQHGHTQPLSSQAGSLSTRAMEASKVAHADQLIEAHERAAEAHEEAAAAHGARFDELSHGNQKGRDKVKLFHAMGGQGKYGRSCRQGQGASAYC